jgi:hypothetical protein
VLCYGRQDVNGETVCLGEVGGDELHPALHESRDEGDVAGKPIKLGNDEGSALEAAGSKGSRELRAIVTLAALDLGVLANERPASAVQVAENGGLLRLKAQPGSPLPRGRDPIIGDEATGWHSRSPFRL